MPGLLRGVARTAVVAGTATAVSNRVSRRQAERWSAQAPPEEPHYEPARVQQMPAQQQPAPTPAVDPIAQLKELGELRASGVLTEEEFAAQKAKILGS
jgi:hypothetical protein